eukprot:Clim_evm56s229 gene=Clim_evmTU56s229
MEFEQISLTEAFNGLDRQLDTEEDEKLTYEIDSWSSHSAQYHPRNILVDRPVEQSSRWSSASTSQIQFVQLRLSKPALVRNVTFGKFHKQHVCNLKEFKVYGGLTKTNMREMLHHGLRNNDVPETFPLRYSADGIFFPVKYIKIVPLMAWGANFNYSIWYVGLSGVQQAELMSQAFHIFDSHREREAVRLCLKYFRQRNYMEQFESLQKRTKVILEAPVLSELHSNIVREGNLKKAEEILETCAREGVFSDFISESSYYPRWRLITPNGPDGGAAQQDARPRMRGGHQMCVDTINEVIYLYGGWDGHVDLADLWAYNIKENVWTCLMYDTAANGGPSARSCHKICFDPQRRRIYTLGRYVDEEGRKSVLESDFFYYDLDGGNWVKLCSNTASRGGPELMYDHQVALDPLTSTMWIFGGRIIRSGHHECPFSGLFSYHIPTDTWNTHIAANGSPTNMDGFGDIKGRVGHSMLFDTNGRQLLIFGGQRHKEVLSDLHALSVETLEHREVFRDCSRSGGPDLGLTQRASIDNNLQELFVITSIIRDKAQGGSGAGSALDPNGFQSAGGRASSVPGGSGSASGSGNANSSGGRIAVWVYSLRRGRWTRIVRENNQSSLHRRYAAQLGANGSGSSGGRGGSGMLGELGDGGRTGEGDLEGETRSGTVTGSAGVSGSSSSIGGTVGTPFGPPEEPRPRLAHQVIFDEVRGRHYLFGGNPGDPGALRLRLDDFWELILQRPTEDSIMRQCRFLVRRQIFKEICEQSSVEALRYLQTSLAEVVDHGDKDESAEFRSLTARLFQRSTKATAPTTAASTPSGDAMSSTPQSSTTGAGEGLVSSTSVDDSMGGQGPEGSNLYTQRMRLYEELVCYFPNHMKQPRANLVDLVTL